MAKFTSHTRHIIRYDRSKRVVEDIIGGNLRGVEEAFPGRINVNQRFEAYRGHEVRGGTTALALAIDRNDKNIIQYLAELGADPFIKSNGRNVYFQLASTPNILREIQEMILYPGNDGGHLNDQDRLGNTPLHQAILNDNASFIDLLLRMGRTVKVSTIKNNQGETPLTMALKCGGRTNIPLMLIEYAHKTGESLYTTDRYGYTPLRLAQEMRQDDVVAAILRPTKSLGGQSVDRSCCCDCHVAHRLDKSLVQNRSKGVSSSDGSTQTPSYQQRATFSNSTQTSNVPDDDENDDDDDDNVDDYDFHDDGNDYIFDETIEYHQQCDTELVDSLNDELDSLKATLRERDDTIRSLSISLTNKDERLRSELAHKEDVIAQKNDMIVALHAQLDSLSLRTLTRMTRDVAIETTRTHSHDDATQTDAHRSNSVGIMTEMSPSPDNTNTLQELHDAQTALADMTVTVEDVRRKNSDLSHEIDKLEGLVRRNDGLVAINEDLQSQLTVAKERESDLTEQRDEMEAGLLMLTASANETRDDLTSTLSTLDNTKRYETSRYDDAKLTIATLTRRLDEANERLRSLEAQCGSSEVEAAEFESRMRSTQNTIQTLQTQLDGAKNTIASLETQMQRQKDENRGLLGRMQISDRVATDLTSKIAILTDQNKSLEGLQTQLRADKTDLEGRLERLRDDNTSLESQLTRLTDDLTAATDANSSLTSILSSTQSRLDECSRKVIELQSEADDQKSLATEAERKHEALLMTFTASKNAVQSQLDTQKSLTQELESKHRTLLKELVIAKDTETELTSLKAQNIELSESNDAASAKVEKLTAELTANKVATDRLVNELKGVKQRNKTLEGKLTDAQSAHRRVTDELRREKETTQSLISREENIVHENNSLTTRLRHLEQNQDSLAEAQTNLENLQTLNESLRVDLTNAGLELAEAQRENQRLVDQQNATTRTINDYIQTIDMLQEAANNHETEMSDFKRQLRQKDDEITRLTEADTELRVTLKNRTKEWNDYRIGLQESARERVESERKLSESQKVVSTLRSENADLTEKLNLATLKAAERKQSHDANLAATRALQRDVRVLTEEKRMLQKTLTETTAKVTRMEDTERQLQIATDKNVALAADVARLRLVDEELSVAQRKIVEDETTLFAMRAEIATRDETIVQCREENTQLRQQLDEMASAERKHRDELNGMYTDYEKQFSEMTRYYDQKETTAKMELNKLEAILKQRQDDLDGYNADKQDMIDRITVLTGDNENKDDTIRQLQSELTAARTELQKTLMQAQQQAAMFQDHYQRLLNRDDDDDDL